MLVQDRGGFLFQPAGILKYVEDLKRGANKDMGPKDFFEMACNKKRVYLPNKGFIENTVSAKRIHRKINKTK